MPKRKIEDEDEWVQRREEILDLYKTKDKSLTEVMRIIEASCGFKRTKPQYERKFKEWKVSKNVRDDEWKFVFARLTERQRLRKTSVVYIRGSLISETRLKKQKTKLRQTTFDKCLEQTERISRATTPPDIKVITPPSSPVPTSEHAEHTTTTVSPNDTTSSSGEMQVVPVDLASLQSAQQEESMENITSVTRPSITSSSIQSPIKHHSSLPEDTILSDDSFALKDTRHAYTLNQSYLMKWFSAIFLVPSVVQSQVNAAGTYSPLATDQVSSTSSWMDPSFQDIILKQVQRENAVMLMVRKVKLEDDLHAFRSLLELRGFGSIALHTFAQRLLLPAIVDGNISLVRVLLDAGVDPDTRMRQEAEAKRHGQDTFQLQLKKDQNHTAMNNTEMTALHVAVYNRREDIITLLLQHGAVDWRADFPGAFHVVSGSILDVVIELGTRQEWMVADSESNRSISYNILKTILHFGSTAAQKSQDMLLRALRHAVLRDRLDLIRLLFEYHPKLLNDVKKAPWMVLEASSTLKDLSLFRFFVQKGFRPDAVDSEGLGSAMAAIASNKHAYKLITELSDMNININGRAFGLGPSEIRSRGMMIAEKSLDSVRGMSALHIAVRNNNESLVRLLLHLGANANHCCSVYPIQLAAWSGHKAIVRMLLDGGADAKAVYEGTGCYSFPRNRLQSLRLSARTAAAGLALAKGHGRLMTMIDGHGVGVSMKKSVSAKWNGMAILGDAIVEANLELFHRLLNDAALPEGKLEHQHGVRALVLAVRHEQTAILPTLLRAGADPYGKIDPSFKGLEHFDDSHMIDPWESPFERAVKISCPDTINLFLLSVSDISGEEERLASKRQICAAYASIICTGDLKLKSLLLDYGLEPKEIDLIMGPYYVQQRLHFALQQAAESKNFVEVERLLDLGAPPNSPNVHAANTSGMVTPLEYAVKNNNISTTRRLVQAGAIINTPALIPEGRTALQLAASNGNQDIVVLLVNSGANINASPAAYNGRTALEAACENGHRDIVIYLCTKGANLEGRNNIHYRRSVYWAWKNGHHTIVDELHKMMVGKNGHDGTLSVEDVVRSVTEEVLKFVDREAKALYEIYQDWENSASETDEDDDGEDEVSETDLHEADVPGRENTSVGTKPFSHNTPLVRNDFWSHFLPGAPDLRHVSTASDEKKDTFSSRSATTNIYEAFMSKQPNNTNAYLWDSVDLE